MGGIVREVDMNAEKVALAERGATLGMIEYPAVTLQKLFRGNQPVVSVCERRTKGVHIICICMCGKSKWRSTYSRAKCFM